MATPAENRVHYFDLNARDAPIALLNRNERAIPSANHTLKTALAKARRLHRR